MAGFTTMLHAILMMHQPTRLLRYWLCRFQTACTHLLFDDESLVVIDGLGCTHSMSTRCNAPSSMKDSGLKWV